MSTKTQTNQTGSSALQYDPGSMGQYQQNVRGYQPLLRGMAQNPFGNPFTQLLMGQGVKSAVQQGQNSQRALQQMMKTSGMAGQSGMGFQNAMQGLLGRQTAAGVSQAQQAAMMSGLQRQMQAIGMGSMFQPLMTGETNQSQATQQQSGLGTWLPQLLGAGLSAGLGYEAMRNQSDTSSPAPFVGGQGPGSIGLMQGPSGAAAQGLGSLSSGGGWGIGGYGVGSNFAPPQAAVPSPFMASNPFLGPGQSSYGF